MMKLTLSFVLITTLFSGTTVPADARRGDEDGAYRALQGGAIRSLRDIETGLVPDMKRRGADYIGGEFLGAARYRLKFMRDGSVIWIDVDGRTGDIVAKAGG
jgi:hypothetical protein